MKDTGKRFFRGQDAIPQKRGTASGVCYPAQAVTVRFKGGVVVLIASSEETLRSAWNHIVDIEMDSRGVQDVVMFAARDTRLSEPQPRPAPHRYSNIYEVGGRPMSRLPHDVKHFASHDTRRREQYGEMGMLGFWGAVVIAFVLAFALILVAFSLPEDVPATVPSAEYGRAPR